mmetsp:Transcript_127686/g.272251  ORF Transcript_127686/g.272251 Transcript_127686/m.272251 type:complete len:350 (+) Transcript_127686:59-1108(+)
MVAPRAVLGAVDILGKNRAEPRLLGLGAEVSLRRRQRVRAHLLQLADPSFALVISTRARTRGPLALGEALTLPDCIRMATMKLDVVIVLESRAFVVRPAFPVVLPTGGDDLLVACAADAYGLAAAHLDCGVFPWVLARTDAPGLTASEAIGHAEGLRLTSRPTGHLPDDCRGHLTEIDVGARGALRIAAHHHAHIGPQRGSHLGGDMAKAFGQLIGVLDLRRLLAECGALVTLGNDHAFPLVPVCPWEGKLRGRHILGEALLADCAEANTAGPEIVPRSWLVRKVRYIIELELRLVRGSSVQRPESFRTTLPLVDAAPRSLWSGHRFCAQKQATAPRSPWKDQCASPLR